MIIQSTEGHVLTHLGLGDQITCNGLIREIYKRHPKLYVYSKLKYFYTIEFMYRDLENLTVFPMEEIGAKSFTDYHKIKNFYRLGLFIQNCTVEQGFYSLAGVEFGKKWNSFHVQRDPERENSLFNSYGLTPYEYIFLHDDYDRRQIIDTGLIRNKNLRVIRANPDHTDNIFDYCKIIELAKEVHVIESCFMFMIDLVFKNIFSLNNNLFIHRYTKPIQPWEYPTNILNWKTYGIPE